MLNATSIYALFRLLLYILFKSREWTHLYGSPLVPYTANISLPRVIYRPRE